MVEIISLQEAEKRVAAVDAAGGSVSQAARDLNIGRGTLRKSLATIKKYHGLAPEIVLVTHAVSENKDADGKLIQIWDKKRLPRGDEEDFEQVEGGVVVGTYTLKDGEGNVITHGVSRKPAPITREAVEAGIREFLAAAPRLEAPAGPHRFDTDVIPWFQIGDAHIGMLAHAAETGANFDLKIAERELCTAISILFDESPARARCVLNDLGDFTHYENMAGVTEGHKNQLDYDVRFPRMIKIYARVMRFIIEKALEKYQDVDVIINRGNHSETNDVWMAVLLQEVYGHTGRVHVLDNTNIFIPYRMGNTFVMVNHGYKLKPEKLVSVMCHDYRQDWGETEFHYIDVGHTHHKMTANEGDGCLMEVWNTLAGRDRFHHESGYRGAQSITRVDRSKTYGNVGRRELPIKEVRAAILAATGQSFDHPDDRKKVHTV